MTKLYFIRHAEAEGNLYRRSQGHYDANITPLGRAQLRALAERFRAVQLDALWASDLHRTQSTAAAVRKAHPELALHLSPRLREIDVGVWEDMPWGNIAARWPKEMEFFTHDPEKWSVTGGEPYRAVADRMEAMARELGEKYPEGSVAVVSHGLAIRALVCRVLGVSSERIGEIPYGDNTSVTLVTVENGTLAVEWYNDASHLDGGLSTFARQSWWREKMRRTPAAKLYSRFEPMDIRREAELYVRCYGSTWEASHGNTDGFAPAAYLASARHHADRDPRCLQKLYSGGELAGLIELDPDRGREADAGWVSLLYIEPDKRNSRLGIQLIGHAVSVFRREGRSFLRLHVSETNENAVGFYEAAGFRPIGKTRGVGGVLLLMEMDIRPVILTPEDI